MDILKKFLAVLSVLVIRMDTDAQTVQHSNAHIGLIYPLSTNGRNAKEYTNDFSLHLIAGVSGSETRISLAGLYLLITDSASGLQCSGFSNIILNKARGVQLAGFMNSVKNGAAGFQAAGFLNLAGSSKGLSMAGFANICRDSSSGAQLAGFINKSGNAGSQAAGFINIAKKVRGVQLAGFINIADSSDYPIALVNFIRNGERSIGISMDETATTLITFRSGSRKLYGIVGIGYNDKDNRSLYAWEAGLGAHVRVAGNIRINMELVTTGLSDFKQGDYFRGSLRVLPALLFGRRIELFAGPNFNYIRSKKDLGSSLVAHYLWSDRESSGLLHGLYFGASGGINIIL